VETSLYTVDCGSRENANTLRKHWFKDAVPVIHPRTELLIRLTEAQAYGLQRDHGFTATPLPPQPDPQ
jgi:hypothetical protein